jgi:hypothetical protein
MFETYAPSAGFDEYMSPSHTPRRAMGALMDQLGPCACTASTTTTGPPSSC